MDAPPDVITVASLSDVGRLRSVNEDSFERFVGPAGARLLVVADGMGGHRGGATASREAVAEIGRVFAARQGVDPGALLTRAIEQANARVFALSQADPELAGMGTTVVALLVDGEGRAAVAHVGDSRCYRWRRGRLEPLTTDHSVVAEMLRRGVLTAEEAAFHPRRNEILRSVGVLPEVVTDVAPVEIAPGDWFLLCSDGLSGVVSEAEIELVLARADSAEHAVRHLVALANESGGPDNVTVQILAIGTDWRPGLSRPTSPPPPLAPQSLSPATCATPSATSPSGPAPAAAPRPPAAPIPDDAADHGPAPIGSRWRRSPRWIALLALLAAAAWWLLGVVRA